MKTANTPILLNAYINKNIANGHLTMKSAECYRTDIMMFFKYLLMLRGTADRIEEITDEQVYNEIKDEDILKVTKDDIWGFILHLTADRTLASTSVKRRQIALKNFYEKFLRDEEEMIEKSPTTGVNVDARERKTPVYLLPEEWKKLLETARRKSRSPERDVCVLTFLLNLGLRREEIRKLDIGDLKLSENVDESYIHIHGKGRKERNIPLNEACISAYEAYLPTRPRPADESDASALFLSNRGKRMDAATIYKMFKKYALMSDLAPKVSPHTLRHTAASIWRKNGASLDEIQVLLGHESITTTTIYAAVPTENFSNIIRNNPANNQ